MVIAVDANSASKVIDILSTYNRKAYIIGSVTDKSGVEIDLEK